MVAGERRAVGGDGDAADEGFGEGEVVAAELGDGSENADGFAGDFGADAVAGEDCDLELHALPRAGQRRWLRIADWRSSNGVQRSFAAFRMTRRS